MTEHITNRQIMRSLRMAGQLVRYHTWPVLRREVIAEHVWHVLRIYVQVFGSPPREVWEYILHHDTPEMGTGDMPFHAKRDNPELKAASNLAEERHRALVGLHVPDITDIEFRRFKACDVLEMLEKGREEVLLGNSFAHAIVVNCERALISMEPGLGPDDFKLVKMHMERVLP